MSSHVHYCPECNRKILCAVQACSNEGPQLCGACGAETLELAPNSFDDAADEVDA